MKFTRHAYHRKKRLNKRWRRPKGLHNKQRLSKKSSTPLVKTGYRSDKTKRFTKNGKAFTVVYNLDQLAQLPKDHAVVIGKIGMKKKVAILKQIIADKKDLLTADPKDALKQLEDKYKQQRKVAEEKAKEREKRQKEAEEKAKKAEAEDKEEDDSDSGDSEKKSSKKSAKKSTTKSAKKSAKKSTKKSSDKEDKKDSEEKSEEEKEKDKVLTKAR